MVEASRAAVAEADAGKVRAQQEAQRVAEWSQQVVADAAVEKANLQQHASEAILAAQSVAAEAAAEAAEGEEGGDGGVKEIPTSAPIQKGFSSLQVSVEKSRNSDLRSLFRYGLGIHHAGMLRSDRSLSEALFARGAVKVL